MTSPPLQFINFLSSPIACVACERLELLRTEISVFFRPFGTSSQSKLFSIRIIFGIYGIYAYGMYAYGMYTYGM